jgi:hypothetical protein
MDKVNLKDVTPDVLEDFQLNLLKQKEQMNTSENNLLAAL